MVSPRLTSWPAAELSSHSLVQHCTLISEYLRLMAKRINIGIFRIIMKWCTNQCNIECMVLPGMLPVFVQPPLKCIINSNLLLDV